METVGSEQEVWKLLFFATFITLHIFIEVYYLIKMIQIPILIFCCLATVDKILVTVAKVAQKSGF